MKGDGFITKSEKKKFNKLFYKYAIDYDCNETEDSKKKQSVERERYMYFKLKNTNLEDTNMEKLLELTVNDIEHQYSVKQDLENKVGFIMALWGILVSLLLQQDVHIALSKLLLSDKNPCIVKVLCIIYIIGLLYALISTLMLMVKILLPGQYSRFVFDDKDSNFKCAVDDKELSMVVLLDGHTNVWSKNETANEKKANNLKVLVIHMALLIVFAIIGCCL